MSIAAAAATKSAIKLHWLDLRGLGISAIERLCLEEALLRHDDRSWALVGTHEPLEHKYLRTTTDDDDVSSSGDCIIVMGIGGKPHELLNVAKVQQDGIVVVKRFSGGGTVVLDHNSLWTTWIGRTADFVDLEAFPRPIMEWSADKVFGPAFDRLKQAALVADSSSSRRQTLVVDSKSCSNDNSGKTVSLSSSSTPRPNIPDFRLRENDYVLGERKIGGNAQSIVKDAWLHHTSFLWDFEPEHMEYLSLPAKRPDYRGDRAHQDFLVKLKDVYGGLQPKDLFQAMKQASEEEFDVTPVTLPEAMAVVNDTFGSMQEWYEGKCRTKLVNLDDY